MRKTMAVAALGLVALAASAGPASADLKFLEPYGKIWSARTLLASPADGRPKDAWQTQESKKADFPSEKWVFSPFVRDGTGDAGPSGISRDGFFVFGAGLAYANTRNERHPWQVNFSYFNLAFDHLDPNLDCFEGIVRYVLFTPSNTYRPVVSILGRFQRFEIFGERYDGSLNIDQKLGRKWYATANVGLAYFDYDNAEDDSQVILNLGVSYAPPGKKWSIHVDYLNGGALDIDQFSISGILTVDNVQSLRLGVGNHRVVFANYMLKWP